MLTYIIAGNYQEGIDFVKKHGIHPYQIVTSIEQVRGQRDIHGYLVGTWRDLKDIEIILWAILARTDTRETKDTISLLLTRIINENKSRELEVYQNQWTPTSYLRRPSP